MLSFGGMPMREIHGLPYTLHQVGEDSWQIVIDNCQRHPAGYTFKPVYSSYRDALRALAQWPDPSADGYDYGAQGDSAGSEDEAFAGDDTGTVYLNSLDL